MMIFLATGGTAEAAGKLIKSTGANVAGFSFVSSIKSLKGEGKLTPLLSSEKAIIYSILEF
jgi:adenine/guanine phosphoribosyltransferase-like PRPP-binding protein